MRDKGKDSKINKVLLIAECILFPLCLIGAAAFRIGAVPFVEANSFFDDAAVQAGQQAALTGFAGKDLYLLLLHGVLFFFGNRVAAAAVLQAVLQIAAAVLFYGAVRKISGRGTALAALAGWGFLPYFFQAYMRLSPAAFIFLAECAAIWTISGIWKLRSGEGGEHPAETVLRYLYIGLLTGLCCCMDISGFLLLLFLFCVILFGREQGGEEDAEAPPGVWNQKGFTGAFCFAAGIVSFVGLQAVFGMISGHNPPYAVGLWLQEVVRGEIVNTWALLFLFCAAAAGYAATGWLGAKAEKKAAAEREIWEMEEAQKAAAERERDSEESDIQYIENPLPLPKKVEKKKMDYDYEVADDDDYDIR